MAEHGIRDGEPRRVELDWEEYNRLLEAERELSRLKALHASSPPSVGADDLVAAPAETESKEIGFDDTLADLPPNAVAIVGFPDGRRTVVMPLPFWFKLTARLRAGHDLSQVLDHLSLLPEDQRLATINRLIATRRSRLVLSA